jgi:hypothetical protein
MVLAGRARQPEADAQRQRRHSNSFDETELLKRVEHDSDTAQNEYAQHHKSLYSRLAANAYKYQYLHKVREAAKFNSTGMVDIWEKTEKMGGKWRV